MADVMTKVCDLCRADGASAFQVQFPDGQLHIDLCADHQQPLSELRALAPDALFLAKGSRRRKDRVVVDPGAI